MAGKKGNGHVGDLNTTVLQAIKAELQAGFAGVNSRLDQLIDNLGEHWRDHERRITAVEQKLGRR